MTRFKTNASWLAALGIALAFVGLLDATYLTVMHVTGQVPPCAVSGADCGAVLNSSLASIGGVPLALIGAVYYLLLMSSLTLFIDRRVRWALQAAVLLSAGGAAASGSLVAVQAAQVQAFCPYCLLSAAICVVLLPTCLLSLAASAKCP